MCFTSTITSKGQITIPKAILERLKGRVVEFVVTADTIELRPAESAQAGLSEYAPSYIPLDEVREAVWGKNVP